MTGTRQQSQTVGDAVLISIHPHYVERILAGEKNIEFRRIWPNRAINTLVVYSTSPTQRLTAVVEVVDVVRGSKAALWRMSVNEGGCITREGLMAYLEGKDIAVALRLGRRQSLDDGVIPRTVFGASFRPPQSFRYLTEVEAARVQNLMKARQ